MPDPVQVPPLEVVVYHEPFNGEPFNPIFKLEYLNQTEELDHRETLEWFRVHGAAATDPELTTVNKALNQAANFGEAVIVISKPHFPKADENSNAPRI